MENNKKKSTKVKVTKTVKPKQSAIEEEFVHINLMSSRVSLAQQFNDLRDQSGHSYFKPEWIMKNVIGLSDQEIADGKNTGI